MSPVVLQQVVRPTPWAGAVAARVTNPLLLMPVFGAFLQTFVTHRVPSLAWTFLLLAAAFVTRVLKMRAAVQERAAVLGADGLLLRDRFVPLAELAGVEQEGERVLIALRSGERVELRVAADEQAGATPVLAALERSLASGRERDAAGQHLLAALRSGELDGVSGDAYRSLSLDDARCLEIVEDPSAAPAARIAAARIVAVHADDAARVRIAEAAEATANPDLREALRVSR